MDFAGVSGQTRPAARVCPFLHFTFSFGGKLSALISARSKAVGWRKQVACPETGRILLSASVTLPPSPFHTHPSLLGSGPAATGLRLEVIFPTESTDHSPFNVSAEPCSRWVKTSSGLWCVGFTARCTAITEVNWEQAVFVIWIGRQTLLKSSQRFVRGLALNSALHLTLRGQVLREVTARCIITAAQKAKALKT